MMADDDGAFKDQSMNTVLQASMVGQVWVSKYG